MFCWHKWTKWVLEAVTVTNNWWPRDEVVSRKCTVQKRTCLKCGKTQVEYL